MKTCLALLACLLFAAPAFAQDMIDPSTIQIVNAPDFRGWTVAGRFNQIIAQPGSTTFLVDGQNCDVTPQQCWPIVTSAKGQLQFTIWLFLQINGQWVGSAFIEGINTYDTTVGDTFAGFATDWYYCCRWNPMTGHVIQEGETIGFMFGGGDNRDSNGPNSGIRSNIVTIQATLGTHTFAPPPPRKITTFDFDGDGKADLTVFRPSTNQWFGLESSTNYTASVTVGFGEPGDIPAPGDYDGDGKMDIAVFRPSNGAWYIGYTSTRTSAAFAWGSAGDVPVPGDYDGDGKVDLAVYRPSTGQWFIARSSTNYTTSLVVSWGVSTDIPVQGDYDGDGKFDPAVYRPSTGQWLILKSSTSYTTNIVSIPWGISGDIPVPGDYDGDGRIDIAVFRPSSGIWYMLLSSTNYTAATTALWGVSGDIPVPGDYDGDGKTDFAVFRPSTGQWLVLLSSSTYTTNIVGTWGVSTDAPIHYD